MDCESESRLRQPAGPAVSDECYCLVKQCLQAATRRARPGSRRRAECRSSGPGNLTVRRGDGDAAGLLLGRLVNLIEGHRLGHASLGQDLKGACHEGKATGSGCQQAAASCARHCVTGPIGEAQPEQAVQRKAKQLTLQRAAVRVVLP